MKAQDIMKWALEKHLQKTINVDDVMIIFEDNETIHCEYEGSNFEIYIADIEEYPNAFPTDIIIEVITWDEELGGKTLTPYRYDN